MLQLFHGAGMTLEGINKFCLLVINHVVGTEEAFKWANDHCPSLNTSTPCDIVTELFTISISFASACIIPALGGED